MSNVDFRSPEEWSEHVEGIKYRLTEDVVWRVGSPTSDIKIIIPKGRVFDVSIPSCLRCIIDPHNPTYRAGGLIHDELLHQYGWTRTRASGEFHDALRAGGTDIPTTLIMWFSVSLFKYS